MAKGPPIETFPSPLTGERLWGTTRGEAEPGHPPPSGAGAVEAPSSADRYEIVGEIARGGIGRVLEANDRELGRSVALKELLRDTPGNRERLRREIRFTARLQHPSIVPLYESVHGPDGSLRYSMKLVSGQTFEAAVAAAPTLEQRLALLPHLVAVAAAVAYAHSRGVVHRDIKPANILLGAFGETVLIDWGVAKELHSGLLAEEEEPVTAAALTRVGAIVGTPAYMAPEQARAEEADPRADVYAIGATLYQMLTGTPPFTGDAGTTIESLRASHAPAAVELGAAGAPPDLLAICRRAMAPLASDRYPSGLELHRDLVRFTTGQLVAARQYSAGDLARRWLRRHLQLVTVVAVALVLLVGTGGVSAGRVLEERDVAREAQGVAEARGDTLTLAQARSVLEADPTESAAWLASYPLRGAGWARAFALALDVESRWPARVAARPPGGSCDAVTMSADGTRALVAGPPGGVIDTFTGAILGSFGLARIEAIVSVAPEIIVAVDSVGWVARADNTGVTTRFGQVHARPTTLAANEAVVLVGDVNGGITGFDLGSGALVGSWSLGKRVTGLALHEGAWVASTAGGELWTAHIPSGKPTDTPPTPRRLAVRPTSIQVLALAPDGTSILGDADGEVVAVSSAGQVEPLFRLPGAVASVAVSTDGRKVAAADALSSVQVLDRRTHRIETAPWVPSRALGLTFSPTAGILAAALEDGSLRLWDATTRVTEVLVHPGKAMAAPAFSPDGRSLAVCGMDGQLRIWPTPPMGGEVFHGHTGRVFHPVFLPNGGLATDSDDHTVRLWTPGESTPRTLQGHTDGVYGIVLRPDGLRLLSAGLDGLATIWDVASGLGIPLRGHEGRVQSAQWLPDGVTTLTVGRDGTLRTWDADGKQLERVQAHAGAAWWATPSGDARSVWSVGADRALRRWYPGENGRINTVLEHLGEPGGATLRTHLISGGRILTCSTADTLLVVAPDGGPTRSLPLPEATVCPSLVVAPDGHHVAVPLERSLGIVDVDDGSWRPFVEGQGELHSAAWSADGRFLATAGLDGTARVWRVSDGAGYVVRRAESAVLGVAFSTDGRRLAVTGVDPSVWVGPVDEQRLLPREPGALHERLVRLTTVRVGGP